MVIPVLKIIKDLGSRRAAHMSPVVRLRTNGRKAWHVVDLSGLFIQLWKITLFP